MFPSQMRKGILEGCILAIISLQETYGYEISRQLQQYGFGEIAEGTVYPLLLRLEKQQYITAAYRQSEIGPKRKYYQITEAGKREMYTFFQNFAQLSQSIARLSKQIGGDFHASGNQSASGTK